MTDVGTLVYNILANDLTKIGTESAAGNMAKMGLAAGAALTDVGGGALLAVDANTKLMGSLDSTAQETGISSDALRDLTMQLSNGKDTISEVTNTMATLGKFNVTSADQMQTAATAALALANANNTTGDIVANNVIPALQAYGLTVDDLGDKSDALTEIAHNTKYGLTDITTILARTAPTAHAAGLSFDDMTSIIEALGEKGVPARNAVSLIDTALLGVTKTSGEAQKKYDDLSTSQTKLGQTIDDDQQKLQILQNEQVKGGTAAANHALEITKLQQKISDESAKFEENKTTLATYQSQIQSGTVDVKSLAASLGVSNDQLTAAKTKIDGAAGSTATYNKIAEEHVGIMANLSSWVEKTTDNLGAELTPLQGVFTAMTMGGSIITGVSGALTLYNTLTAASATTSAAKTAAEVADTTATGGLTASQWLLNAAMDANPIGIVVLALAGLVAGIVLLDQKFHFIQPIVQWFSTELGKIADFAGAVGKGLESIPGIGAAAKLVGLAEGGMISQPTVAMIGEGNEPEYVVPQSKVPGFAAAMGGQSQQTGSGITIINQITVNGLGRNATQVGMDLGNALGATLKNQLRQRGINLQ
jgi:hypothetical protein